MIIVFIILVFGGIYFFLFWKTTKEDETEDNTIDFERPNWDNRDVEWNTLASNELKYLLITDKQEQ